MIRINNVLYDAIPVCAEDGTMSITFANSSLSLSEIEAIFSSDPKIEVLENESVIGTYYNKEIRSLSVKYTGGIRNVIVYLAVTAVAEDIVTILSNRIETLKDELNAVKESAEVSDGAITELADMAADTQSSTAVLEDAIQDLGTLISDLCDTVQTLTDSLNAESEDKTNG